MLHVAHLRKTGLLACKLLTLVYWSSNVLAQQPTPLGQRAIPDDNLAYPVLITLDDGSSGSGFFLDDHQALYLVTAKHVLFKNKAPQQITPQQPDPFELRSGSGTITSYSKDPLDSTKNLFAISFSTLESTGNIKRHPTQDIAVVKISVPHRKEGEAQTIPGVTIKQLAKAGLLSVSTENVKTFDQTLTGNDVIVFGYPGSIGLQEVPQIDYQRPLLRKGIVAGKNPANRSIILDCPVYFGNSGGPVIEIDHKGFLIGFQVIGVILQYVPFKQAAGSETVGITVLGNSGYSVAAPMDFVLELLK